MLTPTFEQYFPASLQVGKGFDIYGEFSTKATIARIFDPHKAKSTWIEIHGRRYHIPDYVRWHPREAASYFEEVCETRDEFQNKFAVEAGIHAEIGAFSGQFDLAYSRDVATSAEHYFCFKNFHQTLGSFELEIGAELPRLLDANFADAVQSLPDRATPDKQFVFDDFFDDYGTHLTGSIQVGGHLDYYVSVSKSVTSEKETIRASLSAEYSSVMFSGRLDAKLDNSKEHQAFAKSRQLTIRGAGGDSSLLGRVIGADPANPDLATVAALGDWAESIARNPTESQFKLLPISKVCGRKETAVAQAIESYQARKRIEILIEQLGRGVEGESPKILVGGMPIEAPKIGASEMGFHVVVLDRTQPAERVGVVLNKVISQKASKANCGALYQQLRALLTVEQYRTDKHLLILGCSGMRTDFAPDSETYTLLLSAGGTEELSRWVELGHGGTVKPVSFSHVGIFGTGRGAGLSDFALHATSKQWLFRSIAFLYGTRGNSSLYRLGAGPRQKRTPDSE